MPRVLQYYKTGIYSKNQHGQVFWIFSWSCMILTSKNWQSKFFSNLILTLIQRRGYFIGHFTINIIDGTFYIKTGYFKFFGKFCYLIFLEKKYERRTNVILDFPFQLPCKVHRFSFIVKHPFGQSNCKIPDIPIFHERVAAWSYSFMWIGIHRNNQLGLF